jgi:hypothetical protein
MLFKPVHIKEIHKILKKSGFYHAISYERSRRSGKSGYILDSHRLTLDGVISIHHSIAYQYPVDWATNGKIMKEYSLKYQEALEQAGLTCYISESSPHFPMLYVIAQQAERTDLYIKQYLHFKQQSNISKNSTELNFQ